MYKMSKGVIFHAKYLLFKMENLYPWYSKLCIIFVNKCQKKDRVNNEN